MKYGKKLLFLPLLTFVICLFAYLLIPKALAQQSNYDVTVSPVFFDLSVNPGGTINEKIRIRNNTTSPIPLKIEVSKLAGDENGQLTLKADDSDGSLSWVKFDDATITARPLEWTNVPFTIEVPETAAYGYYYTVNFTQNSQNKNQTTGASITGAAAVPILLNVRKDGAVAEAKLVEFSPSSFINETLPVDFAVKLENTGNIHVRPRGNIFITRNGKDNIATLEVNPGQSGIIPDSSKTFTVSWRDGFIVREEVMEDGQIKMDDNGKPVTKLTINWNKLTDLRIGKYTANLLMVYDNGTRDVPIEASKSFWVIPWKAITVFVVGIIIAILLVRWMLKRYINREVRRRSSSR
jgi:hypothetical protein